MELDQSASASLAYLVHDLDDAAVRRRVDLLAAEGFAVGIGGFRRHAGEQGQGPGQAALPTRTVVDFGRTMDAQLGRRALSVLARMLLPRDLRGLCADTSVIVARNLEMLALAWRVRRAGQRLVYECLDIHRLMLGGGMKSHVMRWVERRLLARTDLVIVSSPAFARAYFAGRQGRRDRVLLVENKVPGDHPAPVPSARAKPSVAPQVIGWFGMLRCRKTLEQLAEIVRASDGGVEVVIAGIPTPAEFPDFAQAVKGIAGMRYLGPYRPGDLADLYAAVDFVWAVDYFEEGLNSDWLLPNRLYEGLAHGAVPIALRGVETGRWLDRRGVGLLVDDPVAELPGRLAGLTAADRARMRDDIARLPVEDLYQTRQERRAIARALAGALVGPLAGCDHD